MLADDLYMICGILSLFQTSTKIILELLDSRYLLKYVLRLSEHTYELSSNLIHDKPRALYYNFVDDIAKFCIDISKYKG